MPLNPSIAKQMKSDTLTALRVDNDSMEPRDWAAVNNHLRSTKTLREIDLSDAWGAMDLISSGLEQNQTITRLSMGQEFQDANIPVLIRILKANPGITELNLSNCYNLDEPGMAELAEFLKTNQTITHLDIVNMNYDKESFIKRIVSALEGSPNIVHFSPNTKGKLGDTCDANRAAASRLLKAASDNYESLSAVEIQGIKTRLPALLHTAEDNAGFSPQQIAKLLVNLEDVAAAQGIAISIPRIYAGIADDIPRPFHPSANTVDFSTVGTLSMAAAYQAAEAGQVDALVSLLKNGKWKMSAEACLFKPEGKRENMIELIARQGRLPDIMTITYWTGDARGFKKAAEAAPTREWRRQMKDRPLDSLLSQVNAASFKKVHRPQMRLG